MSTVYSRTLLARTRMARIQWIASTVFFSHVNFAVNSLSNKPCLLEHQFLKQSNYFYGHQSSV